MPAGSGLAPEPAAPLSNTLTVAPCRRISDAAPDVPTMKEAGYPDFSVGFFFVMLVPPATPEPIRALLEREVGGPEISGSADADACAGAGTARNEWQRRDGQTQVHGRAMEKCRQGRQYSRRVRRGQTHAGRIS